MPKKIKIPNKIKVQKIEHFGGLKNSNTNWGYFKCIGSVGLY